MKPALRIQPTTPFVIRWGTRGYEPVVKDAFGKWAERGFPMTGTHCHGHDEWRGHQGDTLKWFVDGPGGGTSRCERCAIDALLEGRAVLDNVEGFAAYVAELEAKGQRYEDRRAEFPPLAREVLDAATINWGSEAMNPLLGALQVAARSPERRQELLDALLPLLVEEPAPAPAKKAKAAS